MPCRATVRKMNLLHIPYRKVDVTQDQEAMALVKRLGFLESPVVVVTESAPESSGDYWGSWSGYRPDRINELAEALADDDSA